MTAAIAPPVTGKTLDILAWVDAAPVRFHRTELSSRGISAAFRPVVKAGLVQRPNGCVEWRLTDAGRAALDAATVHVVVNETAMADRAGRRGADWWADHYRTNPGIVRGADGTARIA